MPAWRTWRPVCRCDHVERRGTARCAHVARRAGRADLALQLSCDLGGMDRVMGHHVYRLVPDGDATLLFVLARTFPFRRGQRGQRLCVLGPESYERREGV